MKRTVRIISLAIMLCCLGLTASRAQQLPQYSLYAANPYAFNPGYAGATAGIEANGVFRSQWTGLEGAPMGQSLTAVLPIPYISGGVGLQIENDALGALRFTRFALGYGYGLRLSEGYRLSLGVRAALLQSSLDGAELLAPDGEYGPNLPVHNDNQLPDIRSGATAYEVSAGLFLKGERLQAGVAVLPLTQNTLAYDFNDVTDLLLLRHYTGFLAYDFSLGSKMSLQPSVLVKSDLRQTQAEISALADYDDILQFGLSYRGYNAQTSDALVLIGGFRLFPNVSLRYGYGATLSELREVSQGSHEIMLRYTLDKTLGQGRLPKIIHNPRLL